MYGVCFELEFGKFIILQSESSRYLLKNFVLDINSSKYH
jgi:hypothetical protein